jgi:hypothetical protein
MSLYLAGRQLAKTEDQIKEAALATRAQTLFAMHSLYFSEEEEHRFFYKLDWGTWKFDPKRFAKSNEEPWLDNILYKLDVLGRMVKIGALSRDDAGLLAFQAKRVLGNPQVQAYLNWLAQEYRNEDPTLVPHADARYLASLTSDQISAHPGF